METKALSDGSRTTAQDANGDIGHLFNKVQLKLLRTLFLENFHNIVLVFLKEFSMIK